MYLRAGILAGRAGRRPAGFSEIPPHPRLNEIELTSWEQNGLEEGGLFPTRVMPALPALQVATNHLRISTTYQVTFNQFAAALYQGFRSFLVTRSTTTLSVKFKLNLVIIIWNCNMRLKISTDSQWVCGKRFDEHVGMCTARRVRLQSFPTVSPVLTSKMHWIFTFYQWFIMVWWKR